MSFKRFSHSLYTRTQITIYMAQSPCFLLPLVDSLLFPFVPLSDPLLLTWNPPSCDRIRPPRSQVACKLTSPVPTLSPNPPPTKFPEPQIPSTSQRRPQEQSVVFCPEQLQNCFLIRNSYHILCAFNKSLMYL